MWRKSWNRKSDNPAHSTAFSNPFRICPRPDPSFRLNTLPSRLPGSGSRVVSAAPAAVFNGMPHGSPFSVLYNVIRALKPRSLSNSTRSHVMPKISFFEDSSQQPDFVKHFQRIRQWVSIHFAGVEPALEGKQPGAPWTCGRA